MTEEIRSKINEAEMVLVGIGEEFDLKTVEISEEPYFSLLQEAEEKRISWIKDYITAAFLQKEGNVRARKSYLELGNLLEGKNYFVVTTCLDGEIFKGPFRNDHITAPCGGYSLLQCGKECECNCGSSEDTLKMVWKQLCLHQGKLELIWEPLCTECGHSLGFNHVRQTEYDERGYMDTWSLYRKWLQGTLHRNVCVLELGVGMKYPTVIRWPFEKIVYLNQQAFLYRVHSRLFQLSEELKGRGTSIQADPIAFFTN